MVRRSRTPNVDALTMAKHISDVMPCNCFRCGVWTATRFAHAKRQAILTCTVCGEIVAMEMPEKKFREFVKGVNVFAKLTDVKHPGFIDLYVPGNSMRLPSQEET